MASGLGLDFDSDGDSSSSDEGGFLGLMDYDSDLNPDSDSDSDDYGLFSEEGDPPKSTDVLKIAEVALVAGILTLGGGALYAHRN